MLNFDVATIVKNWFAERADVGRGVIRIPADSLDSLIETLQDAWVKAKVTDPTEPMFVGSPAEQAHLLALESASAEAGSYRQFILVTLTHNGGVKYVWCGNASRVERAGLASLAQRFYAEALDQA